MAKQPRRGKLLWQECCGEAAPLGWHNRRGFPSLPATRRAPACGASPAQTAAEFDTTCEAGERVNFHQYQLLLARSKEQCPALWADQPRGICPVGNWISQLPGLLEPNFWGTGQDFGPLLVVPPCPQQSPLPSSSTFPSTPSMQPAVGPRALNKPGLCKWKKTTADEWKSPPANTGWEEAGEGFVGEEEGLSLSPQHPQAGCCHWPGHPGLLQRPGSPAVLCPAPCAGAPHAGRSCHEWQANTAVIAEQPRPPVRQGGFPVALGLHSKACWGCPAELRVRVSKGAGGCSFPGKWPVCGALENLSAHPLVTAGSNGFCLNPGTGTWVWVLRPCSWGLHIYSLWISSIVTVQLCGTACEQAGTWLWTSCRERLCARQPGVQERCSRIK